MNIRFLPALLVVAAAASAQFYGGGSRGYVPAPCPPGASAGTLCVGGSVISGQNYSGVRTISGCPIWPANSVFHADLSLAPIDEYASQNVIGKAYAITAASWAGGTATVTVASTQGLAIGQKVFVVRVNGTGTSFGKDGYNTGLGCNTNSCVTAGGSFDTRVTITALTDTTISYAVASDPGAYVSDGYVSTGPYAGFRLSHAPSMNLNTALSTAPTYTLSCPGCGEGGRDVPFAEFETLNADNVPYVISNAASLEGQGATVGTGPYYPADAHLLTLQTDTCKLQEVYGLVAAGPPFYAHVGVEWNLRSNQMRTGRYFCPSCTSGIDGPDAAGLPIYPLTLRRAQLYGTEPIDGVIRFTVRSSRLGWAWPAVHRASSNTNVFVPPMGSWWRLRSDFDETPYTDGTAGTPNMRKLIRALKKYGMVVADNGLSGLITSTGDIVGTEDSDVATQLHTILLENFDVLNMQPLQASATSYEVAPFTPVAQKRYVLVSIASSPAGRTINVDGGTCTTPCRYWWSPVDSHTINAATQTTSGVQYSLTSWSDGGAASHTVSPSANATYTATFASAYLTAATPVFSQTGAVMSGTTITLTSTPPDCNAYIYWSASSSTPTTSDNHGTSFTVSAPGTWYAKVIGCPLALTDSAVAADALSLTFGDNFTGGAGADLSANWTRSAALSQSTTKIVQNGDGTASPSAGFNLAAAVVTGQSFTRAQFAQIAITATSGNTGVNLCVLVDQAAGNGYCAVGTSVSRMASGTGTYLFGCGTAPTAGQTWKITITAAGLITVYKDGAAACSGTDTTYTTGAPGFRLQSPNGTATTVKVSAFLAGNN